LHLSSGGCFGVVLGMGSSMTIASFSLTPSDMMPRNKIGRGQQGA